MVKCRLCGKHCSGALMYMHPRHKKGPGARLILEQAPRGPNDEILLCDGCQRAVRTHKGVAEAIAFAMSKMANAMIRRTYRNAPKPVSSVPRFAPGPWDFEQTDFGMADMRVYAPDPDSKSGRITIALVAPTKDDENAYLISAAPELFEALSELIREADRLGMPAYRSWTDITTKARRALRKAAGSPYDTE